MKLLRGFRSVYSLAFIAAVWLVPVVASGQQVMTVLGPVQFTSYKKMSRQNKLPAYVGQWIDGALKLVWPPAVAEQTPVFPIDWKQARE